jgi:hypothetical protein
MKKTFSLILCSAILLATGCASSSVSPSAPLTREAREEPVNSSYQSLSRRLEDLVESDQALSRFRKDELLGVLRRMAERNEEIQTLMNQKKSLLVKELLAYPYRKSRVESLKRSILKLNEDRARNGLQALDQLKEVMGHQDNPQKVMDRVIEMGGRF